MSKPHVYCRVNLGMPWNYVGHAIGDFDQRANGVVVEVVGKHSDADGEVFHCLASNGKEVWVRARYAKLVPPVDPCLDRYWPL